MYFAHCVRVFPMVIASTLCNFRIIARSPDAVQT
ncbi:MAG: hypothetical protein ACJAQW_002108, partial [Paracoccaceae bacterium]